MRTDGADMFGAFTEWQQTVLLTTVIWLPSACQVELYGTVGECSGIGADVAATLVLQRATRTSDVNGSKESGIVPII